MARVTVTSRDAYYRLVLSGKATSQKDRIMRYIIHVQRPVTRHEIDRFFHAQDGRGGYRALDGGTPIPWQSMGGAVAGMKCKVDGCDHSGCKAYLAVDHIGPDPIVNEKVEFLVPIGDRWNQRLMF
jgi:hypothetical protein